MKQLRSRLPGSILVKLAPVGLALALGVMGPTAAFARMHFTTTNDRLTALSQAANSSLALNDPAAIQTQLNEITTQATAAKAAAEEAATRPASNADDKAVLATVAQEMDAVVSSANRAKAATGADQRSALQDIQTRSNQQLQAVQKRIQEQLAAAPAPQAAASPQTLPNSGQVAPGHGFGTIAGLAGGVLLVVGLGSLGMTRWRRSA